MTSIQTIFLIKSRIAHSFKCFAKPVFIKMSLAKVSSVIEIVPKNKQKHQLYKILKK